VSTTLHKLPSSQEIFNLVVEHLFTQSRPARQDDGRCRYRMARGLRCAIGALIPDELYKEEFEGAGVPCLIAKLYALELADWREHKELLDDLQNVHDSCGQTTVGAFNLILLEERLRFVAKSFSLEYPQ
jgi:hypothetical protein